MTLFYRVIRFIMAVIGMPLFNMRIKGKENIPSAAPYIICCNHTSATDVVPIIVAFNKQVFFMAKEELFKRKIPSFIFRKMGVFPISRGNADLKALRKAIGILKENKILGIFPEGTRNPDGPPKKAKAGISLITEKTGVGVVPVSIYRLGKFALFKKTVVRIGKFITPDELKCGRGKEEKQRISNLITERITELWELGY